MELRHEFTVPATVDETWAAFNDIESVAGCFPGAVVNSVDGDSFQGSCKVKLGPIALVYNGSGTFVEKDESAHKMVIEAKGKDKRGNGTAGANVVATMVAEGDSTKVEVLTELNITGKPAQFGRGVMQDVSDKLLGQFTACLEKKVGAEPPAPTDEGGDGGNEVPAPAPESRVHNMRGAEPAAEAPAPRAVPQDIPRATSAPADDGALDLGATVLPVLAKTYWREALIGVLAFLLLVRVLRRH